LFSTAKRDGIRDFFLRESDRIDGEGGTGMDFSSGDSDGVVKLQTATARIQFHRCIGGAKSQTSNGAERSLSSSTIYSEQ
jgi:hypothetical protein